MKNTVYFSHEWRLTEFLPVLGFIGPSWFFPVFNTYVRMKISNMVSLNINFIPQPVYSGRQYLGMLFFISWYFLTYFLTLVNVNIILFVTSAAVCLHTAHAYYKVCFYSDIYLSLDI